MELVGQFAFNDPLAKALIEPASHFPIAPYLRADPLGLPGNASQYLKQK